jgi:hypothetical protein
METKMSHIYLKIKIKSLAVEARMIRAEEQKWKLRSCPYRREYDRAVRAWLADETKSIEVAEAIKPFAGADTLFWGLRCHRTVDVRDEARASLLAYGMLRGRAYARLEAKCEVPPPAKRITELIRKYGPNDPLRNVKHADTVKEWLEAGPE